MLVGADIQSGQLEKRSDNVGLKCCVITLLIALVVV